MLLLLSCSSLLLQHPLLAGVEAAHVVEVVLGVQHQVEVVLPHPPLNVVVNKAVLNLLLHHVPSLLPHLPHSPKYRYAWLLVQRIVS